MFICSSNHLRLYVSQVCSPCVPLVFLRKTGPDEITYSVVMRSVVLERGDGDELGWQRRPSISIRWIHPKNLWTPIFSLVSCIPEGGAREPPRLSSGTSSLIRTEEEDVIRLVPKVFLFDRVVLCVERAHITFKYEVAMVAVSWKGGGVARASELNGRRKTCR